MPITAATTAALAAKRWPTYPKIEETLQPWGSVVLWQNFGRVGGEEKFHVPVRCGRCGAVRRVGVSKVRRQGFTGLCDDCCHGRPRRALRLEDETILESRSVIFWSESSGGIVPVACGKCPADKRVKRYLKITGPIRNGYYPPRRGESPKKYLGLCHAHAHSTNIEDELHSPSGTWVLWSKRDLDDKNRVPILCFNCKEEKVVWVELVRGRDRAHPWSGLCPDCTRERGPLNKQTEDAPLPCAPGLPASTAHWSRREGDQVWVTCGLCELGRWVHKSNAREQGFDGFHKAHLRNPGELLQLLGERLNLGQAADDGRKNEVDRRKKRGPEKGHNAKITEESIRAAFKVLGYFAPQEKLADEIGVDARSLRDWQKARGLSYMQLRKRFTAPEVVS